MTFRDSLSFPDAERFGLSDRIAFWRKLFAERSTQAAGIFLMLLLLAAAIGPMVTPYEYDERIRGDDGSLKTVEDPSLQHPLGTTDQANDVLSRVIYGAQPTALTGLIGGTMIISIGLSIGLVSGYMGGRVDELLMRFTDIAYAVPLIPFALVLISVIGIGFFQSVAIIGLVLWRGSARVIRSQVLQLRERPFTLSARASGAGTPYILIKHILPNVLPMAFLFFALGAGYTIILQAGLAFLGVSNPHVPSWGIMLRNAYNSGLLTQAWLWAIVPGLLISTTVLALFSLGRGYENVAGEESADDAAVQAAG